MSLDNVSMTDHFGVGLECERSGDFADAAMHYALDSLEEIITGGLEPNRSLRVRVAVMLLAISCDAQAGNERRAALLTSVIEPLLADLRTAAAENPNCAGLARVDPVLVGLLEEWTGDAHFYMGDPEALEWYERAEPHYSDAKSVENWGFEEEFTYAHHAFTGFLASTGQSLPEGSDVDFKHRLHVKQELAAELVSTQ